MKLAKIIFTILAILIFVGVVYVFLTNTNVLMVSEPTPDPGLVACTEEAMECPDGSFVSRGGPNCEFAECPVVTEPAPDMSASVVITQPDINALVTSPLELRGQAPGTWFFEGSAPVELRDATGVVIAESFVTASGDWMTTEQVPFAGEIDFTLAPDAVSSTGLLFFKAANPSGLVETSDSVVVPVRFTE